MTSYRIDYAPTETPEETIVVFLADTPDARQRAMRKARQISARKDVSTCYAIATDRADNDTGQRVYSYGAYSHSDGTF